MRLMFSNITCKIIKKDFFFSIFQRKSNLFILFLTKWKIFDGSASVLISSQTLLVILRSGSFFLYLHPNTRKTTVFDEYNRD